MDLPCPFIDWLAVERRCLQCNEKTRARVTAFLLCAVVLHTAGGYPKFAESPFLSSFDSIDGIRRPPTPMSFDVVGSSRGISGPSSKS